MAEGTAAPLVNSTNIANFRKYMAGAGAIYSHNPTMTPNEEFTAQLAQDLAARGEALAAQPAQYTQELQAIIDTLEPLNFRELAGAKPDEKIKARDTLVIAIRELIRIVEAAGAGLTASNGLPYAYNGHYWQEISKEEMQAFLATAATRLGIDELTAQYFETQDKLFKQFLATARLQAKRRTRGQILINFPNGTLEISQAGRWKLRPHDKADFLKYELPYNYDPEATACPLFTAYLNKVQPDRTAQAVLAEFVGNALAPELKLQKALVLNGPGSNGKSVFCDIITALLGRENVSSYTMDSLTKEESRSRAHLENKLLNYSSENSIKMNVEAFKTLVCGEPVEVRRLYQESYLIEGYAKLMFNCNLLPKEVEQSEGFFRRFLIIPFTTKIEESERDPELAAKIIASELPAILNWVLAGLRRLLRAKAFTECESARLALETYKRESNSVLMFIEENELQPGTGEAADKIPLKELYSAYTNYCRGSGYYPMQKANFNKQMQAQGFAGGRDGSKGNWIDCKGFDYGKITYYGN